MINIVYAFFETFAIIDAATQGGPGKATSILVYKVYYEGFKGMDLGSSAAQSVVLMVILITLTVVQFRYSRRRSSTDGRPPRSLRSLPPTGALSALRASGRALMVERRPGLTVLTHLVMIIGVLIVAFPIYVTFVASTQTAEQIVQAPMSLVPGNQLLHNYSSVLTGADGTHRPEIDQQDSPRVQGASLSATDALSSRVNTSAASSTPMGSPLTEHDVYLFREGTHTKLHGKLGCRLDAEGAHFAVWAPNAQAVSLIGDFNGWDAGAHPMSPRWDSSGIWERYVPGVRHAAAYKFRISAKSGGAFDKADPFAFYAQTPPETASRAWSLDYAWGDGEWMAGRAARNGLAAPMSVYEVHPGSWRRRDGRWLIYRELAHELGEYCSTMGFTHVELMPIAEHPFYGSWGYQCTGFFAATARCGTPQDLKYLVDHLHRRGVGVIQSVSSNQ